MPACGIEPKDVIEGPPQRKVPILLRQTSFKALSERVDFVNSADKTRGTHTARFGEIEQRGIALTPKGRALYDALLERVRQIDDAGNTSDDYELRLQQSFAELPDDIDEIRRQGLAYFRYSLIESAGPPASVGGCGDDIEYWISRGLVMADPIIYEDFLPVSAAGIFQSNLGGTEQKRYAATEARSAFERDLGATLLDPFELYASAERRSVEYVMKRLATGVPA